ncbi:PucR C-terminal helix-turn-helix domain-containing protein [Caloramator quimbayensis]|uniref:PucR C-terminal helix-turn-helix domain-containing protein n=1 Tax=Caloramator quimbayensis TaxID=1147123 RepID=A0A1T4Y1K5_9CLOT|nr:helix-turn-helix domain-containing protein [Caloramator quimbayensis]SKA95358.1 PucR C-terminal helix-turn-helix domain-containing protein [Caloramator quimbayensis]
MGFCEGIEKALKCNIGIYDLKGNIICGSNIGFCYTDDILYRDNLTYIRCDRIIISADCLLSQDAISLIRLISSYERGKEAAVFVQPLEYILKNDVSYESLIGRYEGYTSLYIKCTEDVEDVLFNIYSGYDVEIIKDESGIYLIKKFEDVENEANSIINGIWDERGINIIIGSGRIVKDKYTIKHSFEDAKLSAMLAEKLGFKNGYFIYEKMVIYDLINSLDRNDLEKLYDGIYDGFFDVIRDRELINTAEEFLKCDLNISEAARRLYIHRNTLLYRIEKIKSFTGLDIKSFEEAMVFKLLLTIYRLKSK